MQYIIIESPGRNNFARFLSICSASCCDKWEKLNDLNNNSLQCKISPLTDIIISQNNDFYLIIPITEHFVIYKLRTLLLQKLLVAQLVRKLSASLETQVFITECKRSGYLCLSLASWIQSATSIPFCICVYVRFPQRWRLKRHMHLFHTFHVYPTFIHWFQLDNDKRRTVQSCSFSICHSFHTHVTSSLWSKCSP
jgi:hypothetical protein